MTVGVKDLCYDAVVTCLIFAAGRLVFLLLACLNYGEIKYEERKKIHWEEGWSVYPVRNFSESGKTIF